MRIPGFTLSAERRRVVQRLAVLGVLILILATAVVARTGNCDFYPYYWDGKTLFGFSCGSGVDCGSCFTMHDQCHQQCNADYNSGYLTYDDWVYCKSTCNSDKHECLCCVCTP